ncbi:MAG: hypothetical protein IKZ58_04875 [Selenomonadaceae bacterium]|nr:hypothetical protein [Selenomonadaceae bacterium]
MENWEESKQIFISKLRKTDEMFDEIFNVDSGELERVHTIAIDRVKQ